MTRSTISKKNYTLWMHKVNKKKFRHYTYNWHPLLSSDIINQWVTFLNKKSLVYIWVLIEFEIYSWLGKVGKSCSSCRFSNKSTHWFFLCNHSNKWTNRCLDAIASEFHCFHQPLMMLLDNSQLKWFWQERNQNDTHIYYPCYNR